MKSSQKIWKTRFKILALVMLWSCSSLTAHAGFLDYFDFSNWWGDDAESDSAPSAKPDPGAIASPVPPAAPSETPTSVIPTDDSYVTLSAVDACKREELETSFTGLNNLIDYFSAACSLEGISRDAPGSAFQDVSVATCNRLMNARKDCQNMPNPLDQPGMESALMSMERSEELDKVEVESKAAALKNDLMGMKELSLIHHNMASNYQVLAGISMTLRQEHEKMVKGMGNHDFDNTLKKYGLHEAFYKAENEGGGLEAFSLASIAANAFQCTPNRMAEREFDEESSCADENQKKLLRDAKKKLVNDDRSCTGSDCLFGGSEASFGDFDGNNLYQYFNDNNVKNVLSGGENPLFGIGDLGYEQGFGDSRRVADTLDIMNRGQDTAMDEFRKTFNSFSPTTSYENRVTAVRLKGIEEARKRYTNQRLSDKPRLSYMFSEIAKQIAEEEAKGIRFEGYGAFTDADTLHRIAAEVLPEGSPILTDEEITEMHHFSVILRTGANYGEDFAQRTQSFNEIQSLFNIKEEDQGSAFGTMRTKISAISRGSDSDKRDFLEKLENLKKTSPVLQLFLSSNSQSGANPFAALSEVLEVFEKIETESGGKGLVHALSLAESVVANEAIKNCNERRRPRRVKALFCSPLNDRKVSDQALKDLLASTPSSEEDGRQRLSQALLLCAPILQSHFMKSVPAALDSEAISESAGNSCNQIAKDLLGMDNREISSKPDEMAFIFNSECKETASGLAEATGAEDRSAAESCAPDSMTEYRGTWSVMKSAAESVVCSLQAPGATQALADNIQGDGNLDLETRNSTPDGARNVSYSSPFSSRAMKKKGFGRGPGNYENSGPADKNNFYTDTYAANRATVSEPVSSRTRRYEENQSTEPGSFKAMNARDYTARNAAMAAARSGGSSVGRTLDSLGETEDSDDLENIGNQNDPETNALLARLKAKEKELDSRIDFYNNVIASGNKSPEAQASMKNMSSELAALEAEKDALKEQLRQRQRALASQSSPAEVASPSGGFNSFTPAGATISRSTTSAPQDVAPVVAANNIAVAPSVVTSGGSARSRETNSSRVSDVGGIGEEAFSSESGVPLTSNSVLTLTSEMQDRIMDSGLSLTDAALSAKGTFLMPTGTEGVYTLYEPKLDEDGEIITLDGAVQFEKVVLVTKDGAPAKRLAPGASRAIASEIEPAEEESISAHRPSRVIDYEIIKQIVEEGPL